MNGMRYLLQLVKGSHAGVAVAAAGKLSLLWVAVVVAVLGLLAFGGTRLLLAQGNDLAIVSVCVGADGNLRLLGSKAKDDEGCKKHETLVELASGSMVRDVEDLQEQADSTGDALANQAGQLALLDAAIASLQEQDGLLSGELGALNALLASLESRVTALETPLPPPPTFVNHVTNPGFESTPALDGWTQHIGVAAGTTKRVTTQQRDGNASLEVIVTFVSGGAGRVGSEQTFPAAPSEVWSFGTWVKVTALGVPGKNTFELHIIFEDGGNATLSQFRVGQNQVTSDFVQLKVENKTAPANTDHVRYRVRFVSGGAIAGASGTGYFDSNVAVQASSLPEA